MAEYCACQCTKEQHDDRTCNHKCVPYPYNCPCQQWASLDLEYLQSNGTRHHPSCDGKGGHKDVNRLEVKVTANDPARQETAHLVERLINSPDYPPPESEKFEQIAGMMIPKADTSLQLLVIDLGDSCCVRVEKGSMPHTSSDPMKDLGFYGKLSIVRATFQELRDAIDSQDKPVPRIERRDTNSAVDGMPVYLIRQDKDVANDKTALSTSAYDALTALNGGKPLPIYESGKWEQIFTTASYSFKVTRYKQDDEPELPVSTPRPPVFTVWRYTR